MIMDKKIITLLVVLVVAFSAVLFTTQVGAASDDAGKIAVVSIPKIMAQSKYAATMQEQIVQQKNSSMAELEKLRTQMEAVRADMDTRKPGSAEHSKLRRELIEKRAVAEVHKEYLQEELMLQNKLSMEMLYARILEAVREIAQAKGIELVLDCDEVQLPSPSVSELTMMIQTHKVLHYAPSLDITDEVIKLVDSK